MDPCFHAFIGAVRKRTVRAYVVFKNGELCLI